MSTTDAYSLSFFFQHVSKLPACMLRFSELPIPDNENQFLSITILTDRDAEPRSGRRYPHQQSVDIRYPQQHTAALEHNYHQLVDILDNDFKQPLSPRFLWASVTYSTKLCYGSFVN